MADALIPCQYCGGPALAGGDPLAVWCYCTRCQARGPVVARTRPDHDAQAVAAWNAGKKFGRLGVAAVPASMPLATCSLAERLRLVVDSLYAGELGEPDAGVLLLRERGRVHTITHRISDADTVRVLEAVRDTARVRAAAVVPSHSPR